MVQTGGRLQRHGYVSRRFLPSIISRPRRGHVANKSLYNIVCTGAIICNPFSSAIIRYITSTYRRSIRDKRNRITTAFYLYAARSPVKSVFFFFYATKSSRMRGEESKSLKNEMMHCNGGRRGSSSWKLIAPYENFSNKEIIAMSNFILPRIQFKQSDFLLYIYIYNYSKFSENMRNATAIRFQSYLLNNRVAFVRNFQTDFKVSSSVISRDIYYIIIRGTATSFLRSILKVFNFRQLITDGGCGRSIDDQRFSHL